MDGFVDSLDVGDNALTVRWWDGRETPVPFLWLRDNCDCGDCRIEQTSEKRFHLFAVDKHLRPHQAHVVAGADDESIRLVWPDGHQTRYRAMDLLALLAPVRPKIEYWDCRFRPQHFDCGEFRGDDHAVAALIEEFPATGACVLTHGPTEPGSVEQLASRLGPVREVVFERIHNVEIDPKGYNIAHTNVDVPPHNDLVSYT